MPSLDQINRRIALQHRIEQAFEAIKDERDELQRFKDSAEPELSLLRDLVRQLENERSHLRNGLGLVDKAAGEIEQRAELAQRAAAVPA